MYTYTFVYFKSNIFAPGNAKVLLFIMSKQLFFEPYVGNHYKEGIRGKKILVLGASFYCNRVECPFFASCTSVILKDSSEYDNKCPEYKPANNIVSKNRATAVSDFMVSNGIPEDNIEIKWFGKSQNSKFDYPKMKDYRRVIIGIKKMTLDSKV